MKTDKFVYNIKSTGEGSAKYGKCEVCGKHADTVYYQVEKMEFFSTFTGQKELTRFKCTDLFGHKDCLISKRH